MLHQSLVVVALLASRYHPFPQRSPAEVARESMATDRAFASASAQGDMETALRPMLARDVVLAIRTIRGSASFARGREDALTALRADTGSAGARLSWTPIRVGISADGMHGFTYGYTTLVRRDGASVAGKYVAYWEREEEEWRVRVYRRIGRPPGEVSLAERPPIIPARMVVVVDDTALHRRHTEELTETERAFSRDARGGAAIGDAFARYGDPNAANVGNGAEFIFGPMAIGASVQAGIAPGMSIDWGPDEVRVASSGDLGVSIGFITVRRAATGGSGPQDVRIPFFTIWRRDDTRAPWRYVAE